MDLAHRCCTASDMSWLIARDLLRMCTCGLDRVLEQILLPWCLCYYFWCEQSSQQRNYPALRTYTNMCSVSVQEQAGIGWQTNPRAFLVVLCLLRMMISYDFIISLARILGLRFFLFGVLGFKVSFSNLNVVRFFHRHQRGALVKRHDITFAQVFDSSMSSSVL